MSRFVGVFVAACGAALLAAGAAAAQTPLPSLYNRPAYGPGVRPQLSPFLNLTGRNDPAVNYFLGTIPEMDRRATQRVYGAAIVGLEDRALASPPPAGPDVDLFAPLPSTGHPAVFQNTASYFPSMAGRPATSAFQAPRGRR